MPLILSKLLPYIAVLVVCVSIYFVGDMHGATKCAIKEADKQTTDIKKDGENHDKIEFKDSKLTYDVLDKRLDKFVRPSN